MSISVAELYDALRLRWPAYLTTRAAQLPAP
jgi:hypothetical protein